MMTTKAASSTSTARSMRCRSTRTAFRRAGASRRSTAPRPTPRRSSSSGPTAGARPTPWSRATARFARAATIPEPHEFVADVARRGGDGRSGLRRARSRPRPRFRPSRQQPARGGGARHGRRGGVDPGHRRAHAGARLRLAVDGPARRTGRRRRHRQLVDRPDPRRRRGAARHEPRRAADRGVCARRSSATATRWSTCICGGSAPAISARSWRSKRRAAATSPTIAAPRCRSGASRT